MADLPDYLTELTEEAIRERMLERVPSDVDRSEGSYIWDALAPVAYELFEASVGSQEVLRRGFASTAFGSYLDKRTDEHGVNRREAVKARGTVLIGGKPGITIPAGTRVATAADPITNTPSVEMQTDSDAVLDAGGTASVAVTAVEPGLAGNVAAGTIAVMSDSVAGVTSVTNAAGMSGGADTESDESLLERYLLKVRSPGTSGNKADYLQWAMQIDGVGGAQVQPLWNGPGTVRVFVLGADKRAPGAVLVAAVQQAIAPAVGLGDGKAPIGANVTIAPAAEVPIRVSAKLKLRAGATLVQARTAIEQAVTVYLKQLAFTDPVVRISRITGALLDIPSIDDFEQLMVNDSTNNVTVTTGQAAVLGTVSVSV